jgi:hypothetical protein
MGLLVVSCSDRGASEPVQQVETTPLQQLVVSEPQAASVNSGAVHGTVMSVDLPRYAWISAKPGTLPNAIRAQIENRNKDVESSLVSVVNGGFDPVGIEAEAGDTLDVTIWKSDGGKDPVVMKVPTKRPPSVVRSNPPRGRTDVPLNVIITVVFTEPVSPGTVTQSSIQVLRDGRVVSGRVVLRDGWEADFIPNTPLSPASAYEIAVSREVKDVNGEALDAAFSGSFVTGTQKCGDSSNPNECGAAGSNVVTGSIWEKSPAGRRAVANALISAWIQRNDGTGYLIDGISSDDRGQFAIGPLPDGIVQIHAKLTGYDQPCGASVSLPGSGSKTDVEVVPVRNSVSDSTGTKPRMWGGTGYFVPDPVQANVENFVTVPGVRVNLEAPVGFVAVTTTSDQNGFYAFCNIPRITPAALFAVKQGFKPYEKSLTVYSEALGPSLSFIFDIFLER